MLMQTRLGIFMLTALVLTALPVSAQDGGGRVEVAGGAQWIGAIEFAGVPANETTVGGGTRPLFGSATTLDRSIGAAALVGVRLSRQFQAEFTLVYSPTSLTTRITSDVEEIPDATIDAPVTQFLMQGGFVVRPSPWQGRRLSPFLSAGAGYLRQLNDGRTLVESGRAYYFGAGLYYERETSGRRRIKASGLRIDARGLVLQKGVAPDETARVTPAVSAMLFVRF